MKNTINTSHTNIISKKRIDEIDIVKALGIICMVAGHAGAPFTRFIYLFHMAIFFIASGFVYKESSSNSFKSVLTTIFNKVKFIWLPYFLWNMIYTLLNNFFIKVNVYTDNPDLLNYVFGNHVRTHGYMNSTELIKNIYYGIFFRGSTEMGGAFWFLEVIFFISICYCIADFFIKKIFKTSFIPQLIISLFLLCIGYSHHFTRPSFFNLNIVASCYCLYFIGHLLKLLHSKYQTWDFRYYLPIFIASFCTLLLLKNYGQIDLGSNFYMNPIFLLITSLTGWCFLYSLSYFITLIPMKLIFIEIGKRTMSIVILHFLSFLKNFSILSPIPRGIFVEICFFGRHFCILSCIFLHICFESRISCKLPKLNILKKAFQFYQKWDASG